TLGCLLQQAAPGISGNRPCQILGRQSQGIDTAQFVVAQHGPELVNIGDRAPLFTQCSNVNVIWRLGDIGLVDGRRYHARGLNGSPKLPDQLLPGIGIAVVRTVDLVHRCTVAIENLQALALTMRAVVRYGEGMAPITEEYAQIDVVVEHTATMF